MAVTPIRVALLLAVAAVALLALAACGSGPESPTDTATPTATATPTPTPTATATPTTPPPPRPLLSIDETTLGRTVMESFLEAEVSCIRAELGDEVFQAFLDRPVLTDDTILDAFSFHCLATETASNMVIVMLSARVGGLSADSRSCLQVFHAENGFLPPTPTSTSNDADSFRYAIKFQLCLTDEEAQALAAPGEDSSFMPPSDLRCVAWQTDIENFVTFYTGFPELLVEGGEPSPELTLAMSELVAAFEACGLDPVVVDES